jgi:hypothetical protein
MIHSMNGMKDPIALVILSHSTGFGMEGSVSHVRLSSHAVTTSDARKKARFIARFGFA